MRPTTPRSASARASSINWDLRKARKRIASSTIISGPPTNSPRVNCQPRISAMRMPSSTTRLVEANWKVIAAVKFAPLRKSERARATAAYEQEEDAAPSPQAMPIVRSESSGSRRRISPFVTTACTAPESAKPRIRAQRTSQNIPKANESAWTSSWPRAMARRSTPAIRRLAGSRESLHGFEQLLGLRAGSGHVARSERAGDAVAHVLVEDLEGERLECGVDGRDLGEDVDAVAVLLDHPFDPADLSLDAVEALDECVLVFRVSVVHVGEYIPPQCMISDNGEPDDARRPLARHQPGRAQQGVDGAPACALRRPGLRGSDDVCPERERRLQDLACRIGRDPGRRRADHAPTPPQRDRPGPHEGAARAGAGLQPVRGRQERAGEAPCHVPGRQTEPRPRPRARSASLRARRVSRRRAGGLPALPERLREVEAQQCLSREAARRRGHHSELEDGDEAGRARRRVAPIREADLPYIPME